MSFSVQFNKTVFYKRIPIKGFFCIDNLPYSNLSMSYEVIQAITKDAAEKGATIYAQAQGKGITIKQNDCLIAGCALSIGITKIITRDEQDFQKIRKIAGIDFISF